MIVYDTSKPVQSPPASLIYNFSPIVPQSRAFLRNPIPGYECGTFMPPRGLFMWLRMQPVSPSIFTEMTLLVDMITDSYRLIIFLMARSGIQRRLKEDIHQLHMHKKESCFSHPPGSPPRKKPSKAHLLMKIWK